MSNRSEKEKMKDRVRKRAERYRKMKEKSVKEKTYIHVVFEFLQEIEKIYALAKSPDDFKAMMDVCTKMLDEKMKIFDLQIKMDIVWNDTENWQELRVQGVTLHWSPIFRRHNPDKEPTEYIDVSQFLLEDLDL